MHDGLPRRAVTQTRRRSSAPLADSVDELPLAHLRPAGDALALRDLVELLSAAVLERVAGLAFAFFFFPGYRAVGGFVFQDVALDSFRDHPPVVGVAWSNAFAQPWGE